MYTIVWWAHAFPEKLRQSSLFVPDVSIVGIDIGVGRYFGLGGQQQLPVCESTITRKMVPITGRASTFLEIFENYNLNPN